MALALCVVTFFTATSVLLQFAIEATATAVIEAGPSLVVSRVDAGGWAAINEKAALRIASIPGVEAATARVWGVLPGPPATTIMADKSLDGSAHAHVGAGVRLRDGGLQLRGLDGSVADLKVRKHFEPTTGVVSHDLTLVPSEVARTLLLLPDGKATDIAVESVRDEENDALVIEIGKTLDTPVRVTTRAQMLGAYRVQTARSGTFAFASLLPALLGLLLLIWVTSTGGVSARSDVGKLKLMGWSSGEVALLHITETGLVGIVSVGIGLVFAYLGLFVFGGVSVATTVLGWSNQPPHLVLSTEGAALSMLVVGACVLLPCLAAVLFPAWRLARVDPIELVEGP